MQQRKKAYLYSRVSSALQANDGYGIERQVEAAKVFLSRHDEYEVDESTIISDQGVSAYSGANIADSAGLGGFLAAVRDGSIPRGSLLVIEAPDRLTRLGIRKGQRLFDELAEHGIDVGLVRFGVIIKHDEDNDFQSSLIVAVGLYLGHLESKQKSERICATMNKRRNKMRSGEIKSTPHCPSWLTPKEDGTGFELNEFAEVVKLMFKLRLKGMGGHKISTWLNENGYSDKEGDPIRFQRVAHYLRSKAAIGHYQPHKISKVNGKRVNEPLGEPITDFYPPIVSEAEFYEVQKILNNTKGGRGDQFTNYLRDIVKCHVCGHSFTTVVANGRTPDVKYTYHKCVTKTSHGKPDIPRGCESKAISSRIVDEKVLPVLQTLNYIALVSESVLDKAEISRINVEIDKIKESIEENRQALNFLKGAARIAVEAVIDEEEGKLQELRKQLERGPTVANNDLMTQYQQDIHDNTLDTPEKRMDFNAKLKMVVDEIQLMKDRWAIKFKGAEFMLQVDYKHEEPKRIIEDFFSERDNLYGEGYSSVHADEIFDQLEG